MASGTNETVQRVTIRSMSVIQEIKDEQDLCFAAKTGNYQQMAELLQLGVCVEAKNFILHSQSSMTPLQFAAARGHPQCVKLLIDYGAKLNAANESGFTAVHLAAENNHYLCLKILLEAGADPSLPVCRRKYTPNAGSTALHLAAAYRNAKCIEELMRYGADCDAVDDKGRTSLYIAAQDGCEQCILTLLRNIQGVTCLSNCDTSGNIPLHYAVKNRMVECVKEMVNLGADVNHINCEGLSPLHILFVTRRERKHKSDMEILKYLVLDSHNIDINKTTKEGKTALEFALRDSDPEILKFLITYGADVNIKLEYLHLSPLRFLLFKPSSFDSLKCLVNFMPQLPYLESFHEHSALDILYRLRGILHEEELKYLGGATPTVTDKKEGQNMEVMPERKCVPLFSFYNATIIPPNPLQQPLLGKIYEHVTQKLEHMKSNHIHDRIDGTYYLLLHIKKLLWYQQLASNPLTLKHCCRLSIRKYMGPCNLKHIGKLPLPENVKSYLLFKYDEQVEP